MPIGIRHTQYLAYDGTSKKFTNAMRSGQQYLFTANTDCWVKVTTTGGSAAANTTDNILYKAGMPPIPLMSPDNSGTTTNSFVHVIRDAADGDACLMILEM